MAELKKRPPVDVEREAAVEWTNQRRKEVNLSWTDVEEAHVAGQIYAGASRRVLTDEELDLVVQTSIRAGKSSTTSIARAVRDACSEPAKKVTDEELDDIITRTVGFGREYSERDLRDVTRAVRDACEGRKG